MPADRPWFLVKPVSRVVDASESDLRVVLTLFAANKISAEDRATLDKEELSNRVMFDAPHGGALARGTMSNVPFRFQNPARFNGITSAAKPLRMIYRILGATTVDGRDALLIEPISAVVEE
jgi:hypothetical protein